MFFRNHFQESITYPKKTISAKIKQTDYLILRCLFDLQKVLVNCHRDNNKYNINYL